jgi:hypothetical protein
MTGAVPGPVPSPDYHHQVHRGDKAGVVVCGLPAGVPVGRNGRRQPHHPQPPPFPLRRCPGMAGASASRADLRLGRPGQGLRWKFPRYVRAPWELVGSPELPPAPRESLQEYIRRFSKQRTELPNITDSDVIGAFLAGTTCRDLVSKLGRKTPTKASELMDMATKFASGQEAVEAIFRKDKQPQGRQKEDAPEASTPRGTKKKTRKKAQAKRDAIDADLVAAVKHRNPQKPPGGANMFDKMLKESCPYHKGPVKHTLEECDMLRRYFNRAGPSVEGGKDQGNNKKGVTSMKSSERSTTAS